MENEGPYRGPHWSLVFCPKPPNFGVEAHIEAPTGVALMGSLYMSESSAPFR
jgi:hypothetical protein